jgi:hypothetical protein
MTDAEAVATREALIRARAVPRTCLAEKPDDLTNTERANVIIRRISEITILLQGMDEPDA